MLSLTFWYWKFLDTSNSGSLTRVQVILVFPEATVFRPVVALLQGNAFVFLEAFVFARTAQQSYRQRKHSMSMWTLSHAHSWQQREKPRLLSHLGPVYSDVHLHSFWPFSPTTQSPPCSQWFSSHSSKPEKVQTTLQWPLGLVNIWTPFSCHFIASWSPKPLLTACKPGKHPLPGHVVSVNVSAEAWLLQESESQHWLMSSSSGGYKQSMQERHPRCITHTPDPVIKWPV